MATKKKVTEKLKQWEKEKSTTLQISNYGLEKIPEQLFKNKILVSTITSLDLSSNTISNISEKILRFTSLTAINLSRNKFNVFPEILCSITTLTNLRIDNNFINHIPESIGNLTNLKILNISKNNIHSLPEQLSQLQMIEQIETTGNPIHPGYVKVMITQLRKLNQLDLTALELTSIPSSINLLQGQQIDRLILTANRLTSLHPDIFSLTTLRVLELRNNQLTSLLPQISQLQNLEILGIAENLLNTLPTAICTLSKLTFLNLSSNRFTHIPQALFKIPNLRELFLNKNFPGIEVIPVDFEKLEKLTALHLRGNKIRSIEADFRKFKSLKNLNLSENPIKSISSEIFKIQSLQDLDISNTNIPIQIQRIATSTIRKQDELDLSEVKILSFPLDIFLCSKYLKVLYIHKNQLSSIPEEISQLQFLKILTISNNNLSNLPNSISKLQYLEELDFSDNSFNELPDFCCKSLKILKIARNQISTIPKSSILLHNELLQEFYCSGNNISSLENIYSIKSLRILHCNQNKISSIDDRICNLLFIEELFLNENQIDSISNKIIECKQLHTIYLQDNQISIIPKELLFVSNLRLSGNFLPRELTKIFTTINELGCSLDLTEMNLISPPEEILYLTNLHSIDLSNNQIEKFDFDMSKLSKLSKILLAKNSITSLPDWFGNFTCLNHLLLDHSPLVEFPSCLYSLSSLTILSVRFCSLKNLPEQSLSWSLLEEFDCSCNNISFVHSDFISSLINLRTFKCKNNNITILPHSLFQLQHLKSVEANRNQLEYLSDVKTNSLNEKNDQNVVACNSLQFLYLENNSLVELPTWIFEKISLKEFFWDNNFNLPEFYSVICPHLLQKNNTTSSKKIESDNSINLDITFQKLTYVPPIIKLVGPNIISLDLCGNSLTVISDVICDYCINLKYLNISRNRIEDISPCSKLVNLIDLFAINNRIKTFPDIFCTTLKKIERIFLSFNEIKQLNDSIYSFVKLNELHVANNQIEILPPFYKTRAFFKFNFRFNPLKLIEQPEDEGLPVPTFRFRGDSSPGLFNQINNNSNNTNNNNNNRASMFVKSPTHDDPNPNLSKSSRLFSGVRKVSKAFKKNKNEKPLSPPTHKKQQATRTATTVIPIPSKNPPNPLLSRSQSSFPNDQKTPEFLSKSQSINPGRTRTHSKSWEEGSPASDWSSCLSPSRKELSPQRNDFGMGSRGRIPTLKSASDSSQIRQMNPSGIFILPFFLFFQSKISFKS